MDVYINVGIFCSLITLTVPPVGADEFCYDGGFYAEYCKDGYHCCDNNRSCCSNTLTIPEIIGIVVGLLAFICCIAALVFLIVKKNKNRAGTIIRPAGHHQNVTVATVQSGPAYGQQFGHPYGHQGYGQTQYQNFNHPPPPPQYGHPGGAFGHQQQPPSPFVPQPPAYNNPTKGTDPAYPPRL